MRRHRPFLIILIVTAIVRFVILFLSQTHVTSDEAITGLMAKHISEGRYFPFYSYGTFYNASQAWEAYLAVIPFWVFGVGVIALKIPTVILSLASLTLFYVMAQKLYSFRIATLASVFFALWPGLLRWYFQPRGYAFYFLLIPALTILFLNVEKQQRPGRRDTFLFGLVSGLSFWGMELLLFLIIALWILLFLRRKFTFQGLTTAVGGFVLGYAPAIYWNLAHSFLNWHFVFFEKPEAGGLAERFGLSAWREIIFHEMPKFFSADTVLWYYRNTHWSGYVLYAVSLVAVGIAAWAAVRWKQIRSMFWSGFTANALSADLLMLILIGISFVPYVIAPLRVPGYFLGGTFFMALLIARCVDGFVSSPQLFRRIIAVLMFSAVLVCGCDAMVDTATHNQIETLTLCPNHHDLCMTRVPGRDIDAIKTDLAQNQIRAVWTTISFVYPLIFETNEKLIASESIFGVDRAIYPPSIPKLEPSEQARAVFVVETNSPYRSEIETTLTQKSGASPRIREHGALTIIEQRFASQTP